MHRMATCPQPQRRREDMRTEPFIGPVARGDREWSPAHGCVRVTVFCRHCGQQRVENHNGHHIEAGDWEYPEPAGEWLAV